MTPIIAYYRVSTKRQGDSGLGLEAQREIVTAYAARYDHEIVAEFTEVETGKGADALDRRPALAAALDAARKRKCPAVVAKLDRLSRDVHFISGLMAKGVDFIAAELGPNVREFMLNVYAAVAQEERRLISERTRLALAAKRARGERLGNLATLGRAQANGRATGMVEADRFARNVLPIAGQLHADGMGFAAVAAVLNERRIPTARGGRWHDSTVRNLLGRGM